MSFFDLLLDLAGIRRKKCEGGDCGWPPGVLCEACHNNDVKACLWCQEQINNGWLCPGCDGEFRIAVNETHEAAETALHAAKTRALRALGQDQ